MKPRPASATLIAWLVILASFYFLYKMPVSWGSPGVQAELAEGLFPPDSVFGVAYAKHLASLVGCFAILWGFRWGRTLYLVMGIIWTVFDLLHVSGDVTHWWKAMLFVVTVLFFFRKQVGEFFESSEVMRDIDRRTRGR